MKTIDITRELARFEEHLELNAQTILSAKFGDGKTYFLNEYIHQHDADTFFVVLHPVNYVVSPNEDIFEYIKRDILCSLVHRSEFQEIDWNNVLKEILNYYTLLETVDTIASNVPLGNLATIPFHLFKKVDDKFAVDKYFDRFKHTKGGLFEFDQFTFAIQRTIKAIQKAGLRCVLVIEDLDRLDPSHLFRILNVLSAHIDSDKCTNKFCFDNIVAVLDYDTTRHIFHHFYGEKANYEGYMSKFMSSHPFEYSITKVAHEYLFNYIEKECHFSALGEFPSNVDNVTLTKCLAALSVRDVAHILDQIELQIDPQDVELPYHNGIIRSTDYLTHLLAILVRMGYRVGYNALIDFFVDDMDWFKLLNNYVLLSPKAEYKVLNINSDTFTFETVERDGCNSIVWHSPFMGTDSNVSVKDIAKKALNTAIDKVRDCHQIIVTEDIPLGEVYYE
ncbi:MAG: P-loop NTPase fold protein [Paludibacteraceae bacterium]|nr:P-loop NTPase fold protein [Paludibacteraceae bacterium]